MLCLSPDLMLKESSGICPSDQWQRLCSAVIPPLVFNVSLALIMYAVKGDIKAHIRAG